MVPLESVICANLLPTHLLGLLLSHHVAQGYRIWEDRSRMCRKQELCVTKRSPVDQHNDIGRHEALKRVLLCERVGFVSKELARRAKELACGAVCRNRGLIRRMVASGRKHKGS
jgi:hypothetical protein